MRAVKFISSRFNSPATMPRSVRVMRAVAGAGVLIAVVALILAQSIGRGFERVYRKSLLDFNAHVVVMGAGEIDDPAVPMSELEALAFKGDGQAKLVGRWGWIVEAARGAEAALARLGLYSIDPLVPEWVATRYARLCAAVESGIVALSPFLYREALIIGSGKIEGVVVKGIEPGRAASVGGMDIELFEEGELSSALARPAKGAVPAVMGRRLAASMGIGAEPRMIKLLIPREDAAGSRERFEEVLVVGTFQSGMHDYDAQFLLMDIAAARGIFGTGRHAATGIELRIRDPERAGAVAAAAERLLGPRYRAVTWQELNSDLLAAVRLEKLVTSLIMGIMLLVAALNIIAALVLTTLHRLREIAVLKSLGLSNRKIERLFVRGGMGVGMRGVALGLMAGLALAWVLREWRLIPLEAEIYLVDALPIDISWLICGIITLFCALAVYVTSRVAASRLAKLPPAEGLARAR